MEANKKNMSEIIDGLVGLGVVAVFFYLIYSSLKKKYPEWEGGLREYFPYLQDKKPISDLEKVKSRQRWVEHREMI